jgi:hypothetical protein
MDDHYMKLNFERTIELIDTHHPDEIAIEAPSWEKCAIDVEVGTRKVWLWQQDFRDILLRNTNPRKLKWLLLETEMPVKNKLLRCCSNFRTERIT